MDPQGSTNNGAKASDPDGLGLPSYDWESAWPIDRGVSHEFLSPILEGFVLPSMNSQSAAWDVATPLSATDAPSTFSAAPPPVISDSSLFNVELDNASASVGCPTKKTRGRRNQIKKGEGRDAQEDLFDHYDFYGKSAHQMFQQAGETQPSAKLVFEVCKCLVEHDSGTQKVLSFQNRWAKRRMPNAYAWLDQNSSALLAIGFQACITEAKARLNAKQMEVK
jgi:hypothetical protein